MTRLPAASSANAAPHQLATSASEGAADGGKKRILVKERVPSDATTGAPAFVRFGRSCLEGRAAREVEDLGLVVLTLRDRISEVEADRPHRRRPDQAHTDRSANEIRVPDIRAARLGYGERVLWRAIGVAEEIREIRLSRVADKVAGVGEYRPLEADFPGDAEDREVHLRRRAVVARPA